MKHAFDKKPVGQSLAPADVTEPTAPTAPTAPGIDADEMTTPHHDSDPGIDKLPKHDAPDPLVGKNKRDSNESMPARRRV